MVFNPETQHIINFVNDSISNFPLEYQLPIIRELYQIAIDPYTFRKELQWYFETSITGPNLLYGVRKQKGTITVPFVPYGDRMRTTISTYSTNNGYLGLI